MCQCNIYWNNMFSSGFPCRTCMLQTMTPQLLLTIVFWCLTTRVLVQRRVLSVLSPQTRMRSWTFKGWPTGGHVSVNWLTCTQTGQRRTMTQKHCREKQNGSDEGVPTLIPKKLQGALWNRMWSFANPLWHILNWNCACLKLTEYLMFHTWLSTWCYGFVTLTMTYCVGRPVVGGHLSMYEEMILLNVEWCNYTIKNE